MATTKKLSGRKETKREVSQKWDIYYNSVRSIDNVDKRFVFFFNKQTNKKTERKRTKKNPYNHPSHLFE